MQGRRIWALLAVAAVLAMHGLQCVGQPGGSAHAPVGAAHPLTVVDGATAAIVDRAHETAVLAGALATPGHLSPVGLPAHAVGTWAICLAVLFVAFTVGGVATMLWRRNPLLQRGPPSSVRRLQRLHRLPPPPELSALCLLRI